MDCPAAVIPSRAPHSIDVAGCDWCAVMFVEPHTLEGRALAQRLDGQVEFVDRESALVTWRRLEKAWRHGRPDAISELGHGGSPVSRGTAFFASTRPAA
jgi:hypothetical protein